MSNVRKIETLLVATDFSEHANRAIDWARQIARAHDARLILFHALEPPVPAAAAAPEFVVVPPEIYEQQQEYARTRLEEEAATCRHGGTKTEAHLEIGPPASVLVDAAGKLGADLVVLGTRGLTGLERAFLGSVAARVIRQAPCPVLAVPGAPQGRERPIRKLLVPTDFSEDAALAVDAALHLLGPVSSEMKIILLHVWRVPVIFSPWATFPMESLERGAAENARRHLEEAAKPLRAAGFEVEVEECRGEPADEIDRRAAVHDADIIAMGTHGRSGLSRVLLGSVAERTLPTAPCPVLTVHAPETD